jgi:large subunit ribosomal protein L30
MAKEKAKTIKIIRTGGDSHRTDRQIATLHGLGLKRRHQVTEIVDTPAVRGMINKVQHLIRVEE